MQINKYLLHYSDTSDDATKTFRPSRLCSDLAFWKDKCSENSTEYVEARQCQLYNVRINDGQVCAKNEVFCNTKKKCLADVDDCEGGIIFGNEYSCKLQKMHFCPRSNQCIWNDWVCDGFVQCLKGDDEDFEMCLDRKSFPKGATFKCQEANRTGYKIEILAVPCNGIPECQDGIDEHFCKREGQIIVLLSILVAGFIMFIWIAIYLIYDVNNAEEADIGSIEGDMTNFKELKGEALTQFKVR